MTIPAGQLEGLHPGDLIELVITTDGDPITLRGTYPAITDWAATVTGDDPVTVTVLSRAARPLYVNHTRATHVPGDVVRDDDMPDRAETWTYLGNTPEGCWLTVTAAGERYYTHPAAMPARLRLLVDGETGQTAP